MKSPRLMITNLIACLLIYLIISSCSFQNTDELPEQKKDLGYLEEEEPGSEIFLDEDYEVYGDGQGENGMNLAVKGNILHGVSFEEPTPFSLVFNHFCCNHSRQISINPLNSKEKVGRFELRNTDRVKTWTTTSARAEILFPPQKNKERWYAVSIFSPLNGYSKDRVTEIIMQWHQSGYSPPNAVEVKDDKIYLRSINQNVKLNSDKVYTNHPIAVVERGKWNDFVFHYIHSPYSDGLIEIWYNGKKIKSIKGPNMRSGLNLPRFKVGIYKWKWNGGKTSDTSKRVLFFDNILIANENASYNDIINASSNLSSQNSTNNLGSTSSINSFSLIDTDKNSVLGNINDGSSITTKTNQLSITANMPSEFKGKIIFQLTGTKNRKHTESASPFSLYGDTNGNFYSGAGLPPGNYVLTATPIEGNTTGFSKTIKFQLKN